MSKVLLLIICLSSVIIGYSQNELYSSPENQVVINIDESQDWIVYNTFDGILVEYKSEHCQTGKKNQVWLVFRFTNTTNEFKEINWISTWSRNNECLNCDRLDQHEFAHKLSIDADEVLGEDVCVSRDQRFYMFSHFIKVYKGMDEKKITSFDFINVNVNNI